MSERRDRTVASGFPAPDDVPGPTERLRELHGDTDGEPSEPRYGRAPLDRAATEDVVPPDAMGRSDGDRVRATADTLESVGRRVGSEAALRARGEMERRGVPQRLGLARNATSQLTGAGILGACASGTLTAAIVMLWSKVLPNWAAALTTAGILGGAAAPLVYVARGTIRRALAPAP